MQTMGVLGANTLHLNSVAPSATRVSVCACRCHGEPKLLVFLWDELESGEHSECFVLQYNDDRVTVVSVCKDCIPIRLFSAQNTVPAIFPADGAILRGRHVTAIPSTAA